MKSKLKILTLRDCAVCNTFKENLDNLNIDYLEIDCYNPNNDSFCTDFENLVNCKSYPMCVLESNERTIILTMTDDYDKINNTVNIARNEYIIYLHSIDNMITVIQNS